MEPSAADMIDCALNGFSLLSAFAAAAAVVSLSAHENCGSQIVHTACCCVVVVVDANDEHLTESELFGQLARSLARCWELANDPMRTQCAN